MKPDTQKIINDKLTIAATLIDNAMTPLCEAASILILERQFTYAHAIIDTTQGVDYSRGQCFSRMISEKKPDQKVEQKTENKNEKQ